MRIITAASLFDGHDAAINIMRRILQDLGAEVIHLGHNRSVRDIVRAALQEGAQGICVSSYQGGHMEYFKYMRDLLVSCGAPYVKIFGGGGGVIIHEEKMALESYGISRIFHPDDGRRLGLEGMIREVLRICDFDVVPCANEKVPESELQGDLLLGLCLSSIENKSKGRAAWKDQLEKVLGHPERIPVVLGVTGTGGAGKSSLVDELLQRFLNAFEGIRIAVLCVDPSKKKTGGALLGDRIRMNSLSRGGSRGIFMRSLASRGSGNELSDELPAFLKEVKGLNFDVVLVESSGIGQSGSKITEVSDLSLYVMTSDFGSQSQLEKIDMIDYANFIAINKSDRRGALDALRDVRKQFRRSRKQFSSERVTDQDLPIYLTKASQFNDTGVHQLFDGLCKEMAKHNPLFSATSEYKANLRHASPQVIIASERVNYLAEIVDKIRVYKATTQELARSADDIQALMRSREILKGHDSQVLDSKINQLKKSMGKEWTHLEKWEDEAKKYSGAALSYEIRGKIISQELESSTLSGTKFKRVVFPNLSSYGDRIRFARLEQVPGSFPYTAGVFPLKRSEEEPRRQFAGEGTPERTNKRFHYLSAGDKAKRLSTAFDSVTLYGEDPDLRPDIYGKVGESGVSVCCLDDMKKLYAGFDLCDPSTSVSMTINGPAPIILAFFLNTAIDQSVDVLEKKIGRPLNPDEWAQVKFKTLRAVRGTVQADILKEDQAQNTCIFSTEFALKMMGDIQEYFISNEIRNFYSVSISGYHIAEAGANPISQLAFTLSNGFTYVEYYLSRGMKIDDFAPNLSFFFSNGLDLEYTVLGRVARRIWAIAIRELYGGNERSQKLKYHIQTSGRSLHAQEIDFNDIRTTLQALIAIADHCNSLHTNAYDEAITTPTEESVRRAMAIQMIINSEFGLTKCENALQGSYLLEELTDLVEEAVLREFMNLNTRGGVLGAMETQYQRGKIQEESLFYENLKHKGDLKIVGVNAFIDPKTQGADYVPPRIEMARASVHEKNEQLEQVKSWKSTHSASADLEDLKKVATLGGNIFESLMKTSRTCTLGQMTQALYEVGGQFRR